MEENEWTFSDAFFADERFPGSQHVVVFREGKSDWNVLATITTIEENLGAKLSNIPSSPNNE